MFCFYETPTQQAEDLCRADALVCGQLAAACRSADASSCIQAVVNTWGA